MDLDDDGIEQELLPSSPQDRIEEFSDVDVDEDEGLADTLNNQVPARLKDKERATADEDSSQVEARENEAQFQQSDVLSTEQLKVARQQELKNCIWGTTVNVSETLNKYRNFLKHFQQQGGNLNEGFYETILKQMKLTETNYLNLDCQHLYTYDPSLYRQLIRYPSQVLPIFDFATTDMFKLIDVGDTPQNDQPVQVRPFNLTQFHQMRDLNPADIDQLVSIKGMILRSGHIVPELKSAFFQCIICRANVVVDVDQGAIREPTTCANCNAKNTFSLIHNRCIFSDKQFIKLQETVDSIPEGETPQTVMLRVTDTLVDVVRPGDKVLITGIFRTNPVRQTRTSRTINQVFRTYLDVTHFRKTASNKLGVEEGEDREADDATQEYSDTNQVTAEMELKYKQLQDLGKSPDIVKKIVRSFAPSIWELSDLKKGVLCLLFGGTQKKFADKATGKFRSEINTLLVGDPGTSKSQLLQYVHKIAPRGLYTSGKGSSAVGLTAYVVKDPDTGEAVLESGALVLSDKGVCCIDEFDKMTDQTRSILHEAMEQQTVSVAKSGIIASLNARTSILASANPRESKYNPNLSVVDNIQLPPTLLSRFDLIYLVLDKPDKETDRRLARHLVGLYFEEPERDRADILPIQLLTDYISYAKKYCHPQISDEAVDTLVEGYVNMRQLGPSQVAGKRTISATARQLESLIRISEALAKMELSDLVTKSHVAEAIRLMRVAIYATATDPSTGQIDMDVITTGRSQRSRQSLKNLMTVVKDVISALPSDSVKFAALYTQIQSIQQEIIIQQQELEDVLRLLAEEEFIAIGTGMLKNATITRLV